MYVLMRLSDLPRCENQSNARFQLRVKLDCQVSPGQKTQVFPDYQRCFSMDGQSWVVNHRSDLWANIRQGKVKYEGEEMRETGVCSVAAVRFYTIVSNNNKYHLMRIFS